MQVAILFDDAGQIAARDMAGALAARGFQTRALNVERRGDDFLEALFQLRPDRALLAMRSERNRAGCIQGLLEVLRIPYTGSGILGTAIAFNVAKARELLRLHGVRVPSHYVGRVQDLGAMIEQHAGFGYPAQIRSLKGTAALATVAQAADWNHVVAGLVAAGEGEVVVERCHDGDVYSVAMLDGRVLGIHAENGAPEVSEVRGVGLLQTAKSAARALCCQGPSLVHLVVCKASNEWVTDVDAAPAMGRESPFAIIAAGAGYDYATLCETVVDGARLQWDAPALHGTAPRRISQDVELDEVSRVA